MFIVAVTGCSYREGGLQASRAGIKPHQAALVKSVSRGFLHPVIFLDSLPMLILSKSNLLVVWHQLVISLLYRLQVRVWIHDLGEQLRLEMMGGTGSAGRGDALIRSKLRVWPATKKWFLIFALTSPSFTIALPNQTRCHLHPQQPGASPTPKYQMVGI